MRRTSGTKYTLGEGSFNWYFKTDFFFSLGSERRISTGTGSPECIACIGGLSPFPNCTLQRRDPHSPPPASAAGCRVEGVRGGRRGVGLRRNSLLSACSVLLSWGGIWDSRTSQPLLLGLPSRLLDVGPWDGTQPRRHGGPRKFRQETGLCSQDQPPVSPDQ